MAPAGKGSSIQRGASSGATAPGNVQPASPSAKPSEAAGSEELPSGSFVNRMVRFIKAYAIWIIVGLGCLLVALIVWTLLGNRGRKAPREDGLEELGLGRGADSKAAKAPAPGNKTRYSSTKIQKADVKAGLTGTVTTTQVETDREYALVVDEEALKMPPVPEEAGEQPSRPQGDPKKIKELLQAKKHGAAYEDYEKQVKSNPATTFPGDIELALGETLMGAREFDKAARVLEHHVVTHRKEDVRAEAYFNLGYVHFMNRAFNKARRFFKLFLQVETNPEYVARAKKILEKMASPGMRS